MLAAQVLILASLTEILVSAHEHYFDALAFQPAYRFAARERVLKSCKTRPLLKMISLEALIIAPFSESKLTHDIS